MMTTITTTTSDGCRAERMQLLNHLEASSPRGPTVAEVADDDDVVNKSVMSESSNDVEQLQSSHQKRRSSIDRKLHPTRRQYDWNTKIHFYPDIIDASSSSTVMAADTDDWTRSFCRWDSGRRRSSGRRRRQGGGLAGRVTLGGSARKKQLHDEGTTKQRVPSPCSEENVEVRSDPTVIVAAAPFRRLHFVSLSLSDKRGSAAASRHHPTSRSSFRRRRRHLSDPEAAATAASSVNQTIYEGEQLEQQQQQGLTKKQPSSNQISFSRADWKRIPRALLRGRVRQAARWNVLRAVTTKERTRRRREFVRERCWAACGWDPYGNWTSAVSTDHVAPAKSAANPDGSPSVLDNDESGTNVDYSTDEDDDDDVEKAATEQDVDNQQSVLQVSLCVNGRIPDNNSSILPHDSTTDILSEMVVDHEALAKKTVNRQIKSNWYANLRPMRDDDVAAEKAPQRKKGDSEQPQDDKEEAAEQLPTEYQDVDGFKAAADENVGISHQSDQPSVYEQTTMNGSGSTDSWKLFYTSLERSPAAATSTTAEPEVLLEPPFDDYEYVLRRNVNSELRRQQQNRQLPSIKSINVDKKTRQTNRESVVDPPSKGSVRDVKGKTQQQWQPWRVESVPSGSGIYVDPEETASTAVYQNVDDGSSRRQRQREKQGRQYDDSSIYEDLPLDVAYYGSSVDSTSLDLRRRKPDLEQPAARTAPALPARPRTRAWVMVPDSSGSDRKGEQEVDEQLKTATMGRQPRQRIREYPSTVDRYIYEQPDTSSYVAAHFEEKSIPRFDKFSDAFQRENVALYENCPTCPDRTDLDEGSDKAAAGKDRKSAPNVEESSLAPSVSLRPRTSPLVVPRAAVSTTGRTSRHQADDEIHPTGSSSPANARCGQPERLQYVPLHRHRSDVISGGAEAVSRRLQELDELEDTGYSTSRSHLTPYSDDQYESPSNGYNSYEQENSDRRKSTPRTVAKMFTITGCPRMTPERHVTEQFQPEQQQQHVSSDVDVVGGKATGNDLSKRQPLWGTNRKRSDDDQSHTGIVELTSTLPQRRASLVEAMENGAGRSRISDAEQEQEQEQDEFDDECTLRSRSSTHFADDGELPTGRDNVDNIGSTLSLDRQRWRPRPIVGGDDVEAALGRDNARRYWYLVERELPQQQQQVSNRRAENAPLNSRRNVEFRRDYELRPSSSTVEPAASIERHLSNGEASLPSADMQQLRRAARPTDVVCRGVARPKTVSSASQTDLRIEHPVGRLFQTPSAETRRPLVSVVSDRISVTMKSQPRFPLNYASLPLPASAERRKSPTAMDVVRRAPAINYGVGPRWPAVAESNRNDTNGRRRSGGKGAKKNTQNHSNNDKFNGDDDGNNNKNRIRVHLAYPPTTQSEGIRRLATRRRDEEKTGSLRGTSARQRRRQADVGSSQLRQDDQVGTSRGEPRLENTAGDRAVYAVVVHRKRNGRHSPPPPPPKPKDHTHKRAPLGELEQSLLTSKIEAEAAEKDRRRAVGEQWNWIKTSERRNVGQDNAAITADQLQSAFAAAPTGKSIDRSPVRIASTRAAGNSKSTLPPDAIKDLLVQPVGDPAATTAATAASTCAQRKPSPVEQLAGTDIVDGATPENSGRSSKRIKFRVTFAERPTLVTSSQATFMQAGNIISSSNNNNNSCSTSSLSDEPGPPGPEGGHPECGDGRYAALEKLWTRVDEQPSDEKSNSNNAAAVSTGKSNSWVSEPQLNLMTPPPPKQQQATLWSLRPSPANAAAARMSPPRSTDGFGALPATCRTHRTGVPRLQESPPTAKLASGQYVLTFRAKDEKVSNAADELPPTHLLQQQQQKCNHAQEFGGLRLSAWNDADDAVINGSNGGKNVAVMTGTDSCSESGLEAQLPIRELVHRFDQLTCPYMRKPTKL